MTRGGRGRRTGRGVAGELAVLRRSSRITKSVSSTTPIKHGNPNKRQSVGVPRLTRRTATLGTTDALTSEAIPEVPHENELPNSAVSSLGFSVPHGEGEHPISLEIQTGEEPTAAEDKSVETVIQEMKELASRYPALKEEKTKIDEEEKKLEASQQKLKERKDKFEEEYQKLKERKDKFEEEYQKLQKMSDKIKDAYVKGLVDGLL